MTALVLPQPTVAIIAGGLARRMGGRKKYLEVVDGEAVIDRQRAVFAGRFGAMCAVLAKDTSPVDRQPLESRGFEVVCDEVSGRGPLAGIAAALTWAARHQPQATATATSPPVFMVGCDMPHLSGAVIDLLAARAACDRADLTVAKIGGRLEPLHAFYRTTCSQVVEGELWAGRLRLGDLPVACRAAGLRVTEVSESEIRTVDRELLSFSNFNRARGLDSTL